MSSISVYGPTDEAKTEESLPAPETAYGSSKLLAENVHRSWQQAAPGRHLLVLRPVVIFGPGEGGNVTRLVRSLINGYFMYVGNCTARRAGGYVKELCETIRFAIEYQINSGECSTLLNFSTDSSTPMETFVDTVREVAEVKRRYASLPRCLVLALSYPIEVVAQILCIKQPISPTWIRKLSRSTNIEAKGLQTIGYSYHYSLKTAIEDWKFDVPADFSVHS